MLRVQPKVAAEPAAGDATICGQAWVASRTLLTWKVPDADAGENGDKQEARAGAGGGSNMEVVLDEETLEELSKIDTKVYIRA